MTEPAREEVTLEWVQVDEDRWDAKPWSLWRYQDEPWSLIFEDEHGEIVSMLTDLNFEEGQSYAQRLDNVLDGAPVGQVLTREMCDAILATMEGDGTLADFDEDDAIDVLLILAKFRDALLAKFGAAPQVRECPTNHGWINHNVPGAAEWEPWRGFRKGRDHVFKFCPDCGAALETGENNVAG